MFALGLNVGSSSFSSHLLLRRPLFCSFAPREQRRRPFAVTLLGTLSAPLCFSHSASSGRVLQVNNSHKAEHKWPIFFSSLKTRGLRNQGCWKAATQPSDSGVKRLWMRCGDSKTKATVSLRRERWRHGSQKTEAVKHHLRGLLLGFFFLCLSQSNIHERCCQVLSPSKQSREHGYILIHIGGKI